MFDDLKKKIKEVGIESRKCFAEPDHPYHILGGALKTTVILLAVGIVILILANIYYFNSLSHNRGMAAMGFLSNYSRTAESLLTFLFTAIIAFDIVAISCMAIIIKKIVRKEKDVLVFIHKVFIIGYAIVIGITYNDYGKMIINIILLTILFAAVTLYFLLSVRVRVYFGSDEIIVSHPLVKFLYEPLNAQDYKSINEQIRINKASKSNSSINKTNGNEKLKEHSETRKPVVKSEENSDSAESNVKSEAVRLKETSSKTIISQPSVNKNVNDNSKVNARDNRKKENVKVTKHYVNEKKKNDSTSNVLKRVFFVTIKLICIVLLVLALIAFIKKYNIRENILINNIFHLERNSESEIDFTRNQDGSIIEEDKKLIGVDLQKEEELGNKENSQVIKIAKKVTKIPSKIIKLELVIATWKYNKKQEAWNLYLNKQKKLAKDAVYIMDYISPVTKEKCSSTYYFDKEGRLVTGWGIDVNGDYYYFNEDKYDIGKMCTGWKMIDGDEYYFESNGKLLINGETSDGEFVDINGKKAKY